MAQNPDNERDVNQRVAQPIPQDHDDELEMADEDEDFEDDEESEDAEADEEDVEEA